MRKIVAILAVFLLALARLASAQIKSGEASVNLNGSISAGYGDDFSNVAGSDHSITGAGEADLFGSYHNPNFLSFDVQPFYNQSRLNSSFNSLTASSGVNASAKIFGGSEFPGSISYSDNYNSSGNFGLPGLPNFTTHGNSDALVMNWGVLLHGLPSLHFSFSNADSDYSVYGANTLGRVHTDTFSVTSAYRIAGFNLNGGFQYSGNKALGPEFLANDSSQVTHTGAHSFFFGLGHNLPWQGNISLSAARYDVSTQFDDLGISDKYNTNVDTLNGALSFAPLAHLTVGGNTYYTDNLEGTLYNTLLTAGVSEPQIEAPQSSHSLSLTAYANYDMPVQNLHFRAFAERQQQTFLGIQFADDSLNGTAAYSNEIKGGSFNGVLGLTYTSVSTTNQSLLGINSLISYSHAVYHWNVAGSLGYSQNTQTVLIAYTTSGYTYNGSVGRRIGRRSYWGAYASGSRSLLTNEPGTANSNQNYSTSLSLPILSINGSYSVSSGNALLTPTGLVATPTPLPVINPADVVLYNGRAYSVGMSSTPVRGLSLSASFAKALSATNSNSILSNNSNVNMYFLMTYHFRKLNFQAGFNRLDQGFSVTGGPPTMVTSIYAGVSRWFNFF